jgi:hypothetical protein
VIQDRNPLGLYLYLRVYELVPSTSTVGRPFTNSVLREPVL